MPSKEYPLNTSGNCTLDGSGNGRVQLGPDGPGVQWKLTLAAVRVNSAVLEPECRVYIGAQPLDDFFVDGTFTGSMDSTGNVANFPITQGQKVWAVWIGGDPGAIATLSVLGTAVSP